MKDKLENNSYFRIGLMIFLSGAAIIVFFCIATNMDKVGEGFAKLYKVISPFVYGMVMAYLLCPVYNFFVRVTYKGGNKICRTKRGALTLARTVATIVALTVLIGVIVGFGALIIPQAVKSTIGIITELPDKLTTAANFITKAAANSSKYPAIADTLDKYAGTISTKLLAYAQTTLTPKVGALSEVTKGIIVTLRMMLNFMIGIIVCAYFLNSKEKFKAQTKKLIMATMNKKHSDEVFDFANFCNKTFGGFINGKIIDSIIIGFICYFLMRIIGLPYPVLISTIVGITNIIPFFGPFIGAIPGAALIFLVSPLQCLYFIIMIFALQQFDGNILGPAILGETVGIASFWVMFSIIIGGGFFGFLGMVLGVPVFAIIYYYFRKWVNKRLERKSMPSATEDYMDFNKYDISRKDIL